MKRIWTRLIALLSVCAALIASAGCGRSDDSSSTAENSTTANTEMIVQDMTMFDYDPSSDTDTPINEDVSQSGSGNASDSSDGDASSSGGDESSSGGSSESSSGGSESSGGGSESSSGGSSESSGGGSESSSGGGSESSTGGNAESSSGGSESSSGGGNAESSSGGNSESSSNGGSEEYTPDIAGKLVYWMNMSSGDRVFNGDFLNVTFRIKEDVPDGSYEMGIGTCDFANYSAQTVTYNATNGFITIGDVEQPATTTTGTGTISLAAVSQTASPGDEIVMHYTMENNPGVVALIFRFTYDQNALEFISYDVGSDASRYIGLATPESLD